MCHGGLLIISRRRDFTWTDDALSVEFVVLIGRQVFYSLRECVLYFLHEFILSGTFEFHETMRMIFLVDRITQQWKGYARECGYVYVGNEIAR